MYAIPAHLVPPHPAARSRRGGRSSWVVVVLLAALVASSAGCKAFPDVSRQPQFHNPFPQLHRVAILPFNNLSQEPTLDGRRVATLYYSELQQIPGFEVVPVGVVARQIEALGWPAAGATADDYRRLAQSLGVDAVVAGAITDFSPYQPPRLGLTVDWYAANPGFHPVPPGYGLPWGTPEEQYIPDLVVQEAEFALARAQLQTQTPYPPAQDGSARQQLPSRLPRPDAMPHPGADPAPADDLPGPRQLDASPRQLDAPPDQPREQRPPQSLVRPVAHSKQRRGVPQPNPLRATTAGATEMIPGPPQPASQSTSAATRGESGLPANWPDPRGFVPDAPSPAPPPYLPQDAPVLTHTRLYRGDDGRFTEQLARYYTFQDDQRDQGWQSYLANSQDFLRFCCHLHITEMLASRGGAGESRVVWRWPISRYER